MILRELQAKIIENFSTATPTGLILAGIVGCGKTTLIKSCLEILKERHKIYEFSGDDTVFRSRIQSDSKYLFELVRGQTQDRVLIFIDEVQKCEEVFDALKIIFDKGQTSFIVSGSNPQFLQSTARKRLQRRADFKILYPFSLPEVLNTPEIQSAYGVLTKLLKGNEPTSLPHLELTPPFRSIVNRYLLTGGLPLAFLDRNADVALLEIQKAFDRGFEPIRSDLLNISDTVAVELAKLHSKEFTYANIMNQTRVPHRQVINKVIGALIDHGYLGLVTPFLFDDSKRTYLKKYYFLDSGVVTYLTGYRDIERDLGYRIEGLVYSRLSYHLQFELTKNKNLYFFKNYQVSKDGSLRFSEGEVDAIFQSGHRIVPIEIKATDSWQNVNTKPLEEMLADKKLPFGIVFYGGTPIKKGNIYFWPYWLC